MLPGPVGPPDGPGRGPDERDGAEPPTPKGLLPTRGDRGPGFGNRGRGTPVAVPEAPPSSGRGPGRCSTGGRCGVTRWSASGRWGRAGLLVAAGRSSKAGGWGGTRCSAAAGRGGAAGRSTTGSTGVERGGVSETETSGADTGRGPGDGAGPGLRAPGPAGGQDPADPPPLLRPLADAPLACDVDPVPEGNESRSLRATGASTVEEADFTYSPRSASFLSTSLLVTPSSFASSCTRALPATALLTDGAGGNPARPRY